MFLPTQPKEKVWMQTEGVASCWLNTWTNSINRILLSCEHSVLFGRITANIFKLQKPWKYLNIWLQLPIDVFLSGKTLGLEVVCLKCYLHTVSYHPFFSLHYFVISPPKEVVTVHFHMIVLCPLLVCADSPLFLILLPSIFLFYPFSSPPSTFIASLQNKQTNPPCETQSFTAQHGEKQSS